MNTTAKYTNADTGFRLLLVLLTLALSLTAGVETALAYGGPGSIVSGIGALLAVIAAIVASIFGFIWFPLKRLFRKMRGDEEATAEAAAEETGK